MDVAVEHLHFAYPRGDFHLHIGKLHLRAGECVAIVGPSGCGKSTLLKLLSGLLLPQSGGVRTGGILLNTLSDAERRALRIREMGFVFQDFALLDYLTVRQNILLPGRLNPALPLDDALHARAAALAEETGLGSLLDRSVAQLSQGERQRVALCRALIGSPRLILADEPTGNLDPANKRRSFDLLIARARDLGATLAAVTHDHSCLDRFDRTLSLLDFVATSCPSP